MKLLIRVPACEEVPHGYGLVFVDYLRQESIHAPVPLNLLFGGIRAVWIWASYDYYTRTMAQREMHFARCAWNPRASGFRAGIRFRWGSCWLGAHWSSANRRLCINLVPCVTFWIVGPGGVVP